MLVSGYARFSSSSILTALMASAQEIDAVEIYALEALGRERFQG